MALIDFSSVTYDVEELYDVSEAVRLSRERIESGLLAFTMQHEAFSAGYMGESSLAYHSAMMTFYGRCRSIRGIQSQCSSTLFELSINAQAINEYAQQRAEREGATQ